MPLNPLPVLAANDANVGLYLFGFATALVGSTALTYIVRERARRAGLFDPIDERKVHTEAIPRVGGVAIFWAVAFTLIGLVMIFGETALGYAGRDLAVICAGAAAIHGIGLWDDVRPMRARWKFLAQIAIAVAVYYAGVRVTSISLPFAGTVELGTGVAVLFTVFWLVGITNAFNLIDGLDGLASGAAMFALTTMFVVATVNGQSGAAVLTIVLAGATLGFLFFNFPPASIFLGDSGSLFLGFMLAGVGLLSSQKSQTVVAVAIPVVSLGLPVLDTLLAIIRRFLRGQPIFTADRGHIHHRLLGLGHSPRKVALLLYGACAILGLAGMLMVNDSGYVALILVLMGLGVGFAIQRMRFHEFQEVARIFKKGVGQRHVIGRSVKIREATNQLVELTDLDQVFRTLERTFAADNFHRAEIRLRPSFMAGDNPASRDRRLDDDMIVWSWSRNGAAHPEWWEIKLPLLDVGGQRIGSLIMWQDGMESETSLSHVHTIARELRQAVQVKLLELWIPGGRLNAAGASARAVDGVPPRPRTLEDLARKDDIPRAVDGGSARERERKGDLRKVEPRSARPRAS